MRTSVLFASVRRMASSRLRVSLPLTTCSCSPRASGSCAGAAGEVNCRSKYFGEGKVCADAADEIATTKMKRLYLFTPPSHAHTWCDLRVLCGVLVPRSEEHTSELQSQSNLVC